MILARSLALVAALLMGAPGPAAASGGIVWIDLCDAAHPGRRLPLPLDRDDSPGKACHAGACMTTKRGRTK